MLQNSNKIEIILGFGEEMSLYSNKKSYLCLSFVYPDWV